MGSVKYEHIWKLLTEYNFQFISPLNDEFLCIICKTILKSPYQSPCGCRFCMQCISEFLNNKEKNCPGSTVDCKEEPIDFHQNLQIDYIIIKKIAMIKVKCPTVECEFIDELRNIKNHIDSHKTVCPYLNIGCNFPTNKMESIIDHLNTNYYEHGKLFVDSYANIKNELDSIKLLYNLSKQESEKKDKKIMELESQLNKLQDCYCKQIQELNETINYYTEKNKELTVSLLKYETNSNMSIEIDELNKRKESKEVLLPTRDFYFKNGSYAPFIWKINQFKSKQNFNNKNNNLTSNSFYSRNYGYKFCLSVYPNGTGCGFTTHLSVFIHIMNGEYDDHLNWPLKLDLRICLMDQIYGNIYYDRTFNYESANKNEKYMFARPSAFKNMGIGEAQFISLDKLNEHSRIYINDSIILKCYVN